MRIHESKGGLESMTPAIHTDLKYLKCPYERFWDKILERQRAMGGWLLRTRAYFQPVKTIVLQKGYLYSIERNDREVLTGDHFAAAFDPNQAAEIDVNAI